MNTDVYTASTAQAQDDVADTLSMPLHRFVEMCTDWLDETRDGKKLEITDWKRCPVAQHVILNGSKCGAEMVPNVMFCPICGHPVCPDCMNHNVDQISRVTGYLSTVGGWNANKKQEFVDRHRYDLDERGNPINR